MIYYIENLRFYVCTKHQLCMRIIIKADIRFYWVQLPHNVVIMYLLFVMHFALHVLHIKVVLKLSVHRQNIIINQHLLYKLIVKHKGAIRKVINFNCLSFIVSSQNVVIVVNNNNCVTSARAFPNFSFQFSHGWSCFTDSGKPVTRLYRWHQTMPTLNKTGVSRFNPKKVSRNCWEIFISRFKDMPMWQDLI